MAHETFIGTSGWQFPALKEHFKTTKSSTYGDLGNYATLFNSVENNSAFYHIPRITTLQKWYDATPDAFVFSIKLNRLFTHDSKLTLNEERIELLRDFIASLQALQHKLGVVLIQTPPGLHYDLAMLNQFLSTLNELSKTVSHKPKYAVEFRNNAWFTTETYAVLETHNAALVMSQSPRYRMEPIVTADFVYARFHGPEALFSSTYTASQIKEWKEKLYTLAAHKPLYAYFNNTMSSHVIENTLAFATIPSGTD